jgi:hypothetical protein
MRNTYEEHAFPLGMVATSYIRSTRHDSTRDLGDPMRLGMAAVDLGD